MATPGFFDDVTAATKASRERSRAALAVSRDEHYRRAFGDVEALLELLEEGEPCEDQLEEEIGRLDRELGTDEQVQRLDPGRRPNHDLTFRL